MEPIGRSDFSFRINLPRTKLALDREILWNVRSAKAIKIGTPSISFHFEKLEVVDNLNEFIIASFCSEGDL